MIFFVDNQSTLSLYSHFCVHWYIYISFSLSTINLFHMWSSYILQTWSTLINIITLNIVKRLFQFVVTVFETIINSRDTLSVELKQCSHLGYQRLSKLWYEIYDHNTVRKCISFSLTTSASDTFYFPVKSTKQKKWH
jgi:hypothetical protein